MGQEKHPPSFEVTPIKKNISTGDTKSNESNACTTTHDQSSNPEQDSAPSEELASSNLQAELEKLG